MIRVCLVALSLAVVVGPPALSQQQPSVDQRALLDMQKRLNAAPDLSLQPVDTLTCDQMLIEMSSAGKHMSGQLDPSIGAKAQALHDESIGKIAPSSSDPATASANNRARFDEVGAGMANATKGIDLQRMMAVGNRFSAQKCPMPTGPSPRP